MRVVALVGAAISLTNASIDDFELFEGIDILEFGQQLETEYGPTDFPVWELDYDALLDELAGIDSEPMDIESTPYPEELVLRISRKRNRDELDRPAATTTENPEEFEPVVTTNAPNENKRAKLADNREAVLTTRLELVKFMREFPDGELDGVLEQLLRKFPDAGIDIDFLEEERAYILAGPIVPGWLHDLLATGAFTADAVQDERILDYIVSRAPKNSNIAKDRRKLKKMAVVWINYCLIPWFKSKGNGDFCGEVTGLTFSDYNGEYRKLKRLSLTQLNAYLDDFIAHIRREL